jgi:histidinol-phosphate/aromatic aminotransferase/cobyric acid decarboxylase-like protein
MCVFPSQTNFLLLRISGAKLLQELLRAQGIAVRPADNKRLVDAFTEALAG